MCVQTDTFVEPQLYIVSRPK